MSDDIGKLADEVIGRMKTTEELRHVPFEMYARVLNRAVKAEAEADSLRSTIDNMRAMNIKLTWEATGKVLAAEAERDAMREVLEPLVRRLDNIWTKSNLASVFLIADQHGIKYTGETWVEALDIARAALAPSSAGREG